MEKGHTPFSEGGIFSPVEKRSSIFSLHTTKTSVPRAKGIQEIKPKANLESSGWNSQDKAFEVRTLPPSEDSGSSPKAGLMKGKTGSVVV